MTPNDEGAPKGIQNKGELIMLTKFSDFPRYTAGREQITNRNVAGAIASILLPSLGATLAIEGSVAFGVMLIVAGLIVVAMGARSIVIKSNKAHTVNGDYARKLSTLGW